MADLPAYAISLHAPWAWALMCARKDVENRSKTFPCRRDGVEVLGRVWVHASLWPGRGPLKFSFVGEAELMVETWWESIGLLDESYDIRDRDDIARLKAATREKTGVDVPKVSTLDEMRGHIVGSIEVHGYRTPDDPPDSPWYVPGSLAIMVRDPKPLKTLVPTKGALGWWRPTEDVCEQLRRSA